MGHEPVDLDRNRVEECIAIASVHAELERNTIVYVTRWLHKIVNFALLIGSYRYTCSRACMYVRDVYIVSLDIKCMYEKVTTMGLVREPTALTEALRDPEAFASSWPHTTFPHLHVEVYVVSSSLSVRPLPSKILSFSFSVIVIFFFVIPLAFAHSERVSASSLNR